MVSGNAHVPTDAGRSAPRRRAILDAALQVFVERGVAEATIEDVRVVSGASVGSIYHHFGSKERLAGALYAEVLADYQAGLVGPLAENPPPAAGIRGIVEHHLRWVVDRPGPARFLLERLPPEVRATSAERVAEQNAAVVRTLTDWLAPHVAAGRVRDLPPDLLLVILLGPGQEFARAWLRGTATSTIEQASVVLSAAAVAALVA